MEKTVPTSPRRGDAFHKVEGMFVKEISNVPFPEGVWVRCRLMNKTYLPFPLGSYRIMRSGREFAIVHDPLSYVLAGSVKIRFEGEITLRELYKHFPLGNVHGEEITDHNGYVIYKLDSTQRQYVKAVAFFHGALYTPVLPTLSVTVSATDIIAAEPLEENNDKRKPKHDARPERTLDYSYVENIFANAIEITSNKPQKFRKNKQKNKDNFSKEDRWN